MSDLKKKLTKKLPRKEKEAVLDRKTEKEKIEERREEVLKTGRKFKYPLQYSKHRLVVVTIVVAVLALIGSLVTGYILLYKTQTTSDVMYRLVKAIGLPVAKIDGESVPYSDYLMIYRSSTQPLEQQSGELKEDEEAESRKNYYKRAALSEAEEFSYARKLAREQGIEVSSEEVSAAFDAHRKVGGTELSTESFLRILKENFGMSEEEYRRMLELSLVREKVSLKIDEGALKTAEEAVKFLQENGKDFTKAREQFGERAQYEDTGGMVSMQNVDGGRAAKAATLKKGEISEAFVSTNGDGYYIVKCLDKSETEVSYVSLFVEFTEFARRVKEVKEQVKVEEYIEVSG